MEYDKDKVDEMVLALLFLTIHDGGRAWKGHDWEAMNRLHTKGMILNPVGKAKSVVLTEQGEKRCEELFLKHFCSSRGGGETSNGILRRTSRTQVSEADASEWLVLIRPQLAGFQLKVTQSPSTSTRLGQLNPCLVGGSRIQSEFAKRHLKRSINRGLGC